MRLYRRSDQVVINMPLLQSTAIVVLAALDHTVGVGAREGDQREAGIHKWQGGDEIRRNFERSVAPRKWVDNQFKALGPPEQGTCL